MLSKFAQVTDDGQYKQPPHAKLSYGGMLYIRAKYVFVAHYRAPILIMLSMVTGGGWLMAKGSFQAYFSAVNDDLLPAATVAIRYGTVRRQGETGADGLEKQIISYPSTYYRLLPILSHAYVFIQLGKQLVGVTISINNIRH